MMGAAVRQTFERDQFNQRWTLPAEVNAAEDDRLRQICALVPRGVHRALDVGAGQGWLAHYLKELRPEIEMTGVDWSLAGMKQFPARAVVALCNHLPFADEAFDLVTCCDCIEHLPDGIYEQALAEIKRLSRHYIIINTPINEGVIGRDRSTCRCPRCRQLFHCDHHVRYFTREDYAVLLAPEYKLIAEAYGGWDIRFVVKLPLNWAGAIQWGWRPVLICPHCGNRDFANPLWQQKLRWAVSMFDYGITRPFRKRLTRKSEIIALFEKVGS
jgi:SAM-dependent methyltransferase